MKRSLYIIAGLVSLGMLLTRCTEKDQNMDQNAVLKVMLTDAPAEYDSVLIDIQDVLVNASENGDDGSWQSLLVNRGVYNLLDFRNGMDTLLAYLELPPRTISQIRLVLGPGNKIVTGGHTYDLDTPSAQQSGLKLNLHAELVAGVVYELWIDFDAARSVVHKGNGGYNLKPVIRTFSDAISGAIHGNVLPALAMPYVKAVSNGDTLGTYAGSNGSFLIKAVPEGTWTIIFTPATPYLPDTVNHVSVVTGRVTEMDTITFKHP
jgi:hypothetical protein